MLSLRQRSVAVCAAALMCTSIASADLIILSVNRDVSTGYAYIPGGFTPVEVTEDDSRTGVGLADLSVMINDPGTFEGFATQTTSVTESSFMGSLSGSFDAQEGIDGLGTPIGAQANAELAVFFQLTEATTFSISFSSSVTGTTTATSYQGLAVDGVRLDLGGPDVTDVVTLDAGSHIFRMNIEHTSDGIGAGAFTSTFSFNVIPAPGGLAVFALGLLARPRRRRE